MFSGLCGADSRLCVTFNGLVYKTLVDGIELNRTISTCQSSFLSVPTGWQLAICTPAVVSNVIGRYMWSTNVLVCADGVGYRTTRYPPGGGLFASGMLTNSGNTFKPSVCHVHILISSTLYVFVKLLESSTSDSVRTTLPKLRSHLCGDLVPVLSMCDSCFFFFF